MPPSGRMPKGGYFFDAIIRQEPIDEDQLNPEDNCEEFGLLSDADLAYYRAQRERLDASGRTAARCWSFPAPPSATSPWCRPRS